MNRRWVLAAMLVVSTLAQATERNTPVRLEPDPAPVKGQAIEPGLKLTLHEVSVDVPTGRAVRGAPLQRQADGPELPLNSFAAVCFEADTDGYVTLWESSMSDAGSTLLLPNDLSVRDNPLNDRAHPVKAGQATCVGEGAWAFRVDGPAGSRHIYAHWTATREDAVPVDAYAMLGRDQGGQRAQQVWRSGYQAELRYRVVDAGGR